MEIINVKVNELKEYENNPRNNEGAIKAVENSIKEFGFKIPIVIDTSNVIVAGHTRVKACKNLGIEVVPCIVADDLTEEQIKAFRLVDNKTSELAEWDFNKLNAELYELSLDMTQFEFEIDDLDIDNFGEEFELPDDDKPATRTITLSLSEEQFIICTNCMDYMTDNNLIEHTFNNHNKRSNSLFEVVYQWAEQKNLL